MASITSAGIGSGLDIGGLVRQLVAAEGQPAEERIARQEARTQAKLSAFGKLKSALAEFRDKLAAMTDPADFLARTARSGNEDVLDVSVGPAAVPAVYAVEVLALATAQKLRTDAFADPGAAIGTGTLDIALGTQGFSVDIDEENNTLAGIRDAINGAADNPGVTASIVNAEGGSYLILGAAETGASRTLRITQSGGDGGLAALVWDPDGGGAALTELTAASDATLRVDGLEVTSENNTVAGAIEGVTMSLVEAAPGEVFDLRIENDEAAVRRTIGELVDSWNGLMRTIDELTAFDPESGLAAALQGDATVRGIREQIRRELSGAVRSVDLPFGTLSEIGVHTELDGKLSLDDAALSDVLAADFTRLGQLFANAEDGIATRLHGIVDGLLDASGAIETRSAGLSQRMEEYGDARAMLSRRLEALETRLLRQFNALDALVAQLSATSNFLAEQLANLPQIPGPGRK